MSSKKILFISQNASRSGAPILLLSIIQKLHLDFDIDVLFLQGGEILEEFNPLSTNILTINSFQKKYNLYNKITATLTQRKTLLNKEQLEKKAIDYIVNKNYDVIIGNTIATLHFLLQLPKTNKAIYLHELTYALEANYSKNYIVENLSKIPKIFAGSDSVKENLKCRYSINENRIETIHSFVDEKDSKIVLTNVELRNKLMISSDTVILGLMSTPELRKGTDLLPQIAKCIVKKQPQLDFKIVNIGGKENDSFINQVRLDAEKINISDKFIFIPSTTNPNDFINMFDLFLLPSREDPFPLVMHMSGNFQKPIIAFKDSGGISEVIPQPQLAEYLDIEDYSDKIIELCLNKTKRLLYGKELKETLNSNFSGDISIAKLKAAISEML